MRKQQKEIRLTINMAIVNLNYFEYDFNKYSAMCVCLYD